MHRYKDNRNMSQRISNYDQRSVSRIYIRNSEIQRVQETYERETTRCNISCYLMNKKLSVTFKRLWKYQEQQSRKIWNWWTEEKDIELTVMIKDKKIWTLVNSASDISYMNSQLCKNLEIKNKERKQILIVYDVK